MTDFGGEEPVTESSGEVELESNPLKRSTKLIDFSKFETENSPKENTTNSMVPEIEGYENLVTDADTLLKNILKKVESSPDGDTDDEGSIDFENDTSEPMV